MAKTANALTRALDLLERQYGKPKRPIPKAPLDWILWENVAYLVDDERRERAYRLLEKRVGLSAEKLAKASRDALHEVTGQGGMHPEQRVDRLKDIAELALAHGGGDLGGLLAQPLAQARKILRKFPSIGAPGAEKILLFTKASPELALESNGLRAAVRLGFGKQQKSYASTYKSAQLALEPLLERSCPARMRAWQLLRTHGQVLCKNTSPDCDACPLTAQCRHFAQLG